MIISKALKELAEDRHDLGNLLNAKVGESALK
jgi:hypothetical protein